MKIVARASAAATRHFCLAAVFVSISASGLGQLQSGSPWPKAFVNAQNTSVGPGINLDHTILWDFGTNAGVQCQPTISKDGTVYFGSGDGHAYALNAATGAFKWSILVSGTNAYVNSSPAIGADGTVYFGATDGNVYALDGATGLQKWSLLTGAGIVGSPAIGADGTVYIGSYDGYLYALDGAAGTLKWSFQTVSQGLGSCPAIGVDGTVFFCANAGVYALDPATGTQKWFDKIFAGQTSPAIAPDGTVFVSDNPTGTLYALDPATGNTKWSNKLGGTIQSTPTVSPGGTVFVGTGDAPDVLGQFTSGNVFAIDGATGAVNWSLAEGSEVFSSPTIGKDGTVYVGSWDAKVDEYGGTQILDGRFQALDGATGASLWTFLTAGAISGSPAIGADGTIYFGANTNNGITTYPNYSFFALGAPAVSGLTLATVKAPGSTAIAAYVTLKNSVLAGTGDKVSLESSSPIAKVPASVTVSNSEKTAHFTITTLPVSSNVSVTITASLGGSTGSTTFTVTPALVSTLALVQTTMVGGSTANCNITLSGPAGPQGDVVSLSSSAGLTVPKSVTIPAGQNGAQFSVSSSAVSATTGRTITATLGASTRSMTVTVTTPAIKEVAFSTPAALGGGTVKCSILLQGVAGPGGDVITLTSTGSIGVPATVTVPHGANGVVFQVSSSAVSATTLGTVTARLGSSTLTGTLRLTAGP